MSLLLLLAHYVEKSVTAMAIFVLIGAQCPTVEPFSVVHTPGNVPNFVATTSRQAAYETKLQHY